MDKKKTLWWVSQITLALCAVLETFFFGWFVLGKFPQLGEDMGAMVFFFHFVLLLMIWTSFSYEIDYYFDYYYEERPAPSIKLLLSETKEKICFSPPHNHKLVVLKETGYIKSLAKNKWLGTGIVLCYGESWNGEKTEMMQYSARFEITCKKDNYIFKCIEGNTLEFR